MGRGDNPLPNNQQAWIAFAIRALMAALAALLG